MSDEPSQRLRVRDPKSPTRKGKASTTSATWCRNATAECLGSHGFPLIGYEAQIDLDKCNVEEGSLAMALWVANKKTLVRSGGKRDGKEYVQQSLAVRRRSLRLNR